MNNNMTNVLNIFEMPNQVSEMDKDHVYKYLIKHHRANKPFDEFGFFAASFRSPA